VLAGGTVQAQRLREVLERRPGLLGAVVVLQSIRRVELPGVVEIERGPDDVELPEVGPLEALDDGVGVLDSRVDDALDRLVVAGGRIEGLRPVADRLDQRTQERRRLGRRGLSEEVAHVRPVVHRALHPVVLVVDGPELLGEHQLVERQYERDAGHRRSDERLEGRLYRVVGDERRGSAVDDQRGTDDAGERQKQDTERDDLPVYVQ
jgi:hypothetical protein